MPDNPKSVAIVAMGSSHRTFTSLAVSLGDYRRVADEVWAINSMGGVIQHHRCFVIDDFETKLRDNVRENPECMTAGMFGWLKEHPGPIYTSKVYPGYPGAVEYPLEDVINAIGVPYLNTSVAYAVAFAIAIGVENLHLYGCDFTYPDRHIAESGRACVEFLLGIAGSRGMSITVAGDSTIMDACVAPDQKFYGYRDAIALDRQDDGRLRVKHVSRDDEEGMAKVNEIHQYKSKPGYNVAEKYRIGPPRISSPDGELVGARE